MFLLLGGDSLLLFIKDLFLANPRTFFHFFNIFLYNEIQNIPILGFMKETYLLYYSIWLDPSNLHLSYHSRWLDILIHLFSLQCKDYFNLENLKHVQSVLLFAFFHTHLILGVTCWVVFAPEVYDLAVLW